MFEHPNSLLEINYLEIYNKCSSLVLCLAGVTLSVNSFLMGCCKVCRQNTRMYLYHIITKLIEGADSISNPSKLVSNVQTCKFWCASFESILLLQYTLLVISDWKILSIKNYKVHDIKYCLLTNVAASPGSSNFRIVPFDATVLTSILKEFAIPTWRTSGGATAWYKLDPSTWTIGCFENKTNSPGKK